MYRFIFCYLERYKKQRRIQNSIKHLRRCSLLKWPTFKKSLHSRYLTGFWIDLWKKFYFQCIYYGKSGRLSSLLYLELLLHPQFFQLEIFLVYLKLLNTLTKSFISHPFAIASAPPFFLFCFFFVFALLLHLLFFYLWH